MGKWRILVLGTDGFGRSDSRENLRKFFEIDSDSIVYTSLKLIGKEKEAKQFSKNKDIFTNQGNPWQI